RVMQACFDVGASYVDTAGDSAASIGQEGGVLSQLALDAAWRDRGITGIVSMGSDPGISNIMARIASDRFSAVDAIRIRKAATGEKETDGFPLHRRRGRGDEAGWLEGRSARIGDDGASRGEPPSRDHRGTLLDRRGVRDRHHDDPAETRGPPRGPGPGGAGPGTPATGLGE